MTVEGHLIEAARELAAEADKIVFGAPVSHVYNPLSYAWAAHEQYLRKFGGGGKQVVFVGMNPGPFGMAQTGVPFGEVAAVRDWMGIRAQIGRPATEHPARPVQGFACPRSEVSGKRLWGLFAERFGAPENFFERHFVVNYCPLSFLGARGENLTPDKLRGAGVDALEEACGAHLRKVAEALRPEWMIGVGEFAARRAREAADGLPVMVGRILHPSPASPAANRGWAEKATSQLQALGVWK